MMKTALAVILTAAWPGINARPITTQKPADGCALLQATEIQTLAGNSIRDGKPSTDNLESRKCRYEWGSGANVQSGRSVLNVGAFPLANIFPRWDASLVRQGFLAKVKLGDPNVAAIPDIGDAAIYESDAPTRVTVTALAKGYMLIVTFESADARARKDQVIALVKAAATRL